MTSQLRFLALQLLAPLLAILFGALVGSGILLAIDKDPLAVYGLMVRFNLTRADSLAAILFKSTPLILAGLAVALAFRVVLWNIGVEGQYYIGAFAAAYAGFAFAGLPAVLHLPIVVLAGMAGGMAWALVPIVLKLKRGAHEVITTIMMNYIANALVLYLLEPGLLRDPAQIGTPLVRTPPIATGARLPSAGPLLSLVGVTDPAYARVNWMLPVGLVLCLFFGYMLRRWRFGYEVRAVAHNPEAAEAAGIPIQRVQLTMFMLSGAVAGLVGLSDILGFFGFFDIDFPKGYGFLGISVALLAKNSPVGVIPAALLFGFLDRGAQGVQVLAGVPREVIIIQQGVIILAIVVGYELLTRYIQAQRKREARAAPAPPVPVPAGAGDGGA